MLDRKNSQAGAAFPEAAIGIIIILFIILFGIDFLRVSYSWVLGHQVLAEAAEWTEYGIISDGHSTRAESAQARVISTAQRYGFTVTAAQVSICSGFRVQCDGESDLLPGEIFTIRLRIPMKMLVAFGHSFDFNFEVIGQREPV